MDQLQTRMQPCAFGEVQAVVGKAARTRVMSGKSTNPPDRWTKRYRNVEASDARATRVARIARARLEQERLEELEQLRLEVADLRQRYLAARLGVD